MADQADGSAGRDAPRKTAYGRLELVKHHASIRTPVSQLQKMGLYRCAQLAKHRGKSHFLMYDSLTAAATGRSTALPGVDMVGGVHTAEVFVLLLEGAQPGALETDSVLRELAPVAGGSK